MRLDLDTGIVDACQSAAGRIVADVMAEIEGKTTLSVERATARLLGVDGEQDGLPLPNVVVDTMPREQLAEGYARRDALFDSESPITLHAERKMQALKARVDERREFRESLDHSGPTLRYVLTATGDIDEDVSHALAVAEAGGDIIAVIRSTAQSLLDHVPYGATHEGFGGTYATQANMAIMREALDEWSLRNGRYVRLSNFASGLCMPEITVMAATEGLDNIVNDCLYGILYRDINPVRGMIDQRFSRLLSGWSGIVINTGEDNYARTADTMECAPAVTASWFINYFMAKACNVPDDQIGLGLAFEINPNIPHSLGYEIAHAQLLRQCFPDCPVKYMPPTSHMNGNLYRTHATDTMFNLVTELTAPGIQTIGVPTEGIFTPEIGDRVIGMQNVNYVSLGAQGLGDDLEFKADGLIETRAKEILTSSRQLLERIAERGLFAAIADGTFGDVKRPKDAGKGRDGVIDKAADYFNPVEDILNV